MRMNDLVGDFAKYHALGNDYCVIDPRRTEFLLSPENIRLVCDRHFGLGCDGVLYGPLPGVRSPDHWIIKEDVVEIDLGTASLDSDSVGALGPRRRMLGEPLCVLGERLELTCVDSGNPHCAVPLDRARVTAETARALGAALRDHELFPDQVNVQLVYVQGRGSIWIAVFERGAGYTLASGSCASAAAFAAHVLGLAEHDVKVHMPGGVVDVTISPDDRVRLSGRVQAVLSGRWAPELRSERQGSAN
jgi:diaminopimelate epimerase